MPSITPSTYSRRTSLSLCSRGSHSAAFKQHGVGPGGEFHVGGKAGAAGPDHARLGNVLDGDLLMEF